MILHVHIPEKKLNLQALHIYKIKRVYIHPNMFIFTERSRSYSPLPS